ncbi:hypothetical protein ED733_001082 [Metarhizium rileyi]|uniref:Chromatin assembly factor 1 subunit A n=1 Tax=Metarhizium rileyi (strain RCEF 4871) TaxID=1649241 RepID=A0A5C6G4J3_METRR|nr:hypothetical protein ED733_001082 [Metarhizium rileyi]
MSPNVQETGAVGRKRCHDEFATDFAKIDDCPNAKTPKPTDIRPSGDSCGSPALTESGSSTAARNSPCPTTPTKAIPRDNSSDQHALDSRAASTRSTAPKRKRLTGVEKAAKEQQQIEKKKEREEQAAKKAAEKAKHEEEKAARAKQAAAKAKEKAQERDEKRRKKDEEQRKKEEEQRRVQEEKDKKARSQPKLNAFFKVPGTLKNAGNDRGIAAGGPTKLEGRDLPIKQVETEYERLFKPFFVRENTRLAPSATQMDEGIREAKSQTLDDIVTGQRDVANQVFSKFDPVEALRLPGRIPRRGCIHLPVKHIMEAAYKEAEKSNIAGGNGANNMLQEARKKLAGIPQKVITFSNDVRPSYYGTVTWNPYALGRNAMARLARKSVGRRLPLDYDYDSEAEWQEDEGEDVDMDDDEEELDDEDDMDGFLDDADDSGLSRRVFGNTIEPECTGVCYENHHRLSPNQTVYEHKMEFIHEGLEQTWGIDPFSARYWEPEIKAQAANACSSTPESITTMPPPRAPANAFAALNGGVTNPSAPAKLVKAELLNDFKKAILDNKALSKVGIVDFIFHQFRDSVSRAEVKNTLEHVAEKKGTGRSKEWDLKPGHELVLL